MRSFADIRRGVLLMGTGAVVGAAVFGGAWAWAAGGTSIGGGTKVSSLPSCAVANDGQTVFYQNATMATSGVVWRLRCNAGSSSAYKWEFVGGSPLSAEGSGPSSNTNTSYSTGTTNIPSVSIPLAGEYSVEYGAQGRSEANVCWSDVFLAPHYGGTILSTSEIYMVGSCNSVISVQTMENTVRRTLATAGSNLDVRYRIQQSSRTFSMWMMRLSATPIRVG